jgi:hypothetical protein
MIVRKGKKCYNVLMKLTHKTAIVSALLLIGFPCFAEGTPPTNVGQVNASAENGSITVTWSAAENATGIAFYRVYFSHQSILGNSGNYDDFVQTEGSTTTYVFPTSPVQGNRIFFSVLAVNSAGTESEGFQTEADLTIPETTTPDVQEPPASEGTTVAPAIPTEGNPTTTAEPMTILSATPTSSTGILVTFSKTIALGAQVSADVFIVTDSGGIVLPLSTAIVQGNAILLHSDRQEPGKIYVVGLRGNVQAEDGTNATPAVGQVSFQGYNQAPIPQPVSSQPVASEPAVPYGKNPSLQSSAPAVYGQAPQNTVPENPSNLFLSAERLKNGFYNVVARWQGSPDTQKTLASYGLYTSPDGMNFVSNSLADKSETSVRFNDVSPGIFGLRVTARNTTGNESLGIQQVITLPASGLGLFGILTASGFVAGRRIRRKKSTAGSC